MLPADKFLDRFMANIRETKLLEPQHQILLAVSGGMDSMAMLDLFYKSGFSVGIAHCNFRLRGEAADKDQQFVERIARQLGVRFYKSSFDTMAYAKEHKLSIQMAARELRYDWLEKIMAEQGYDLVATAHHLDDSIETMVINLCRGTGISGLTGIPERTKKIIRPLLFASRKEIEAYIEHYEIEYRDDASNAEEKYLRNKIRHQIIPVLHEINPSIKATLKEFFSNMQTTAEIFHDAIDQIKKECVRYEKDSLRINTTRLLSSHHADLVLFEVLKELGFSPPVCKDIAKNLNRQAGKLFYSDRHTLLTDRNELHVYPTIRNNPDNTALIYESTKQLQFNNYTFHFEIIDMSVSSTPEWPKYETITFLDYNKLLFPLIIRCWKKGDRITPLGMSGSKKLSDLFVEKKIPLNKKNNIPIIVSDNKIIWVAGIKSSDSTKITKTTQRILKITSAPGADKTN
jgi:tRNA(Ile)-lysidine synthase